MSGIPKSRLIVYGTLIVALVALLALRVSDESETGIAGPIVRDTAPIQVPGLEVARSLTQSAEIGARDVFRAIPKPAPKPVATPQPAAEEAPKRPDPIEIAIEQAKKALEPVRLIGVVASGEGALAVFEYDGNTHSRVVGDQIVSGFKLERISQGEIRARHERLGLVAVLSLGGVRPMQWTRIE